MSPPSVAALTFGHVTEEGGDSEGVDEHADRLGGYQVAPRLCVAYPGYHPPHLGVPQTHTHTHAHSDTTKESRHTRQKTKE